MGGLSSRTFERCTHRGQLARECRAPEGGSEENVANGRKNATGSEEGSLGANSRWQALEIFRQTFPTSRDRSWRSPSDLARSGLALVRAPAHAHDVLQAPHNASRPGGGGVGGVHAGFGHGMRTKLAIAHWDARARAAHVRSTRLRRCYVGIAGGPSQ